MDKNIPKSQSFVFDASSSYMFNLVTTDEIDTFEIDDIQNFKQHLEEWSKYYTLYSIKGCHIDINVTNTSVTNSDCTIAIVDNFIILDIEDHKDLIRHVMGNLNSANTPSQSIKLKPTQSNSFVLDCTFDNSPISAISCLATKPRFRILAISHSESKTCFECTVSLNILLSNPDN